MTKEHQPPSFQNSSLSDSENFQIIPSQHISSSDMTLNDPISPVRIHSETGVNEDLPWKQLILIYGVCAANIMTTFMMGPILPQYCIDRLHVLKNDTGTATGAITSAYILGNALTSPKAGYLSDIYGRKVFVVLGLSVTILCNLVMPFLSSVWAAIFVRFVNGACNQNSVMANAYISDITQGKSPAIRSLAFGYLGAVYGLGRSIFSAFSGLITGLPLGTWNASVGNPYITPFFATSILTTALASLVIPWLPESVHNSPILKENEHLDDESLKTHESHGQDDVASEVEGDTSRDDRSLSSRHAQLSFFDKLRYLVRVGGSPLILFIIIFTINHFSNGSLLVVCVLLWNMDLADGGSGLDVRGIGVYFAIFGLCGIIFQFLVFPILRRHLNEVNYYRFGACLLGVGSWLIYVGRRWTGILTCIFLAPAGIGFMSGLPVLMNILSSLVPSDVQGLCQGVANSVAMIGRTIGPFCLGFLFNVCAKRGQLWPSFLILVVNYVICILATFLADHQSANSDPSYGALPVQAPRS